jgi:Flp pilus assembly protein TadD
MLSTWADGPTVATAALAANHLAPNDARTLNLLGLATLRWRGGEGADAAWQLWQRALSMDARHVPAAVNLAAIAGATGDVRVQRATRAELERRLDGAVWTDLDGPTLPLVFAGAAVRRP